MNRRDYQIYNQARSWLTAATADRAATETARDQGEPSRRQRGLGMCRGSSLGLACDWPAALAPRAAIKTAR